jgi:hypothetical protein
MTGAEMKRAALQLVERVKAIMLSPSSEWLMIEKEPSTLTGLLLRYVAILAAIPEVAHLIGQSLIGTVHTPIVSNLLRAIIVYLVTFAMVYIIAGVIDLLAPRFGGRKNFPNAVKLSVYSHTPLWLAGIFLLIPGLNFLVILGLYGFYLLWVGLPLLMRVKKEQALPYAVFVTACALVPAVVLSLV